MNLPHGEALLFAKEILDKNNDVVKVRCEFSTFPTLAMFIEAAAQSSAAFNSDSDTSVKIGFLTMAKDVKLLNKIRKKNYIIKVEIQIEVTNIKQFYFEVYEEFSDIKYASGYFTLIIQE